MFFEDTYGHRREDSNRVIRVNHVCKSRYELPEPLNCRSRNDCRDPFNVNPVCALLYPAAYLIPDVASLSCQCIPDLQNSDTKARI